MENQNLKEYLRILDQKRHLSNEHGIKPLWIPDTMFDYQAYAAEHLIKRGRAAGFLDTGMGKTFIELVKAVNYLRATNKPILILTPLAVAFQFISEAEKFGIDDISYSKDGKYKTKIVIANYERLHYFNPNDFHCVICDESSALKNDESVTFDNVNKYMRNIKYRFLFTATPSPNDFIELGTSSEVLGHLGYVDMLTKFFTNKQKSLSPATIGVEWVLKGHAKTAFFEWASSWSLSMRKPSDLGFSDERHILPELFTGATLTAKAHC
jgi:superfamily II DNA or RNA helicase